MSTPSKSKKLRRLAAAAVVATLSVIGLTAQATAEPNSQESFRDSNFEILSDSCPTAWTMREEFGTTYCDHIVQSSFHGLFVPEGVEELGVLAIGGGGGGGAGGYDDVNDQMLAGGGGGAGEVVQTTIEVPALSTLVIEVGAGGAGGTVNQDTFSASNGQAGQDTTIRINGELVNLVRANAGSGGQSGTNGGNGGESGSGLPGGSGYTGGGSSAGGGGGGLLAAGTDGAPNNGGDGGLSGTVLGQNGLPLFFDPTHSLRAADVVPYSNLFPTLDHYPNIINFTGLGFGGGGAVVTSDGNGCDYVRQGNNVTLNDDTVTYEGYGACLMGPSGSDYNGQASLDMSGAYPGQGGSGGAGMGQIFVGPSAAEFSSANVETYEAGTQGVNGIVWLTFPLGGGSVDVGSYLDINEDRISWGDSFSYITDAPLGTTISMIYRGDLVGTLEHSANTTVEWDSLPQVVTEACNIEFLVLTIEGGPFSIYDYVDVEGNSTLEGCWGHWDANILPQNSFAGAELDQLMVDDGDPDSRSFVIDDWESENTRDAFDDFGYILIADTLLSPQEEDCSFFGDGQLRSELFYDANPTRGFSNGDFHQILISCAIPDVTLGDGSVDFRVDLVVQGSMIGWYVYTTGISGSPADFRPEIQGELGSDELTTFEELDQTDVYSSFMTFGDIGDPDPNDFLRADPIIGYRSSIPFSASVEEEDIVIVQAAEMVSPAAGENLVFMLEMWLIDYIAAYESEALELARAFAVGDYEFGHCLASVLSASPTIEDQCGELQPVPYVGPVVTNDPQVARSGSTVTYVGTNLDDVVAARVAGNVVQILSQSATSITLSTPTGIANGMYDVDLHYANAEVLTLQNGLVVQDLMKVWTQLQSDNTVKMYAKNIIGEGKIQFFHNNQEIAWVRATNALNPKLRQANGSSYLVRTRELVAGKNAFEIYQDGKRIWRAAYSG